MKSPLRVGLLGGGTIARLVLGELRAGRLSDIEIVALTGRAGSARAAALAREYGVPYVTGRDALVAARPAAVLEAASHDAVPEHVVALLGAGISVVILSAGALVDDVLRRSAEEVAQRSGARRYVPSAGIGSREPVEG